MDIKQHHAPQVPAQMYGPIPSLVLTIVIFFGAQFIASVFLLIPMMFIGASSISGESFLESPLGQFTFIAFADSLIFGSLVWLLKIKNLRLKHIGLSWPQLSDVGRALIAYGVYMLLFIAIAAVAKAVAPSLNLEQEQQLGFKANQGILGLVAAGISLVVLPPIVEELLCRGFLYSGLRTKLKVIPSSLLTSVVFAIAHLQFGSDAPLLWVAAIDTFVLSLVLVYLREKTGSLAAPMLLHGLKNAIAFCILFIFV